MTLKPSPIQPIDRDARGVLRFRENRIVSRVLDVAKAQGYGLNEIACGDFTAEERQQFAQLIGYSLDGYGDLSYVGAEAYGVAALTAESSQM